MANFRESWTLDVYENLAERLRDTVFEIPQRHQFFLGYAHSCRFDPVKKPAVDYHHVDDVKVDFQVEFGGSLDFCSI